jgi:hypothetical protein
MEHRVPPRASPSFQHRSLRNVPGEQRGADAPEKHDRDHSLLLLEDPAGELIAKAAADKGARPVPAGRNLARVNRSPSWPSA